jgi:predicted hotdog family 3-hydroxylacyl-ACP dehydratase
MRAELPPVAELLPHAGPVVLLDRVIAHDAETTVCAVTLRPGSLLAEPDGSVPAYAGIEYMAQCIAAHAGLLEREAGRAPRPGFLLGARAVEIHVVRLGLGQSLEIRAQRVWGEASGMVSFDCSVRDRDTGARLLCGRLSCFLPPPGHPMLGTTGAVPA